MGWLIFSVVCSFSLVLRAGRFLRGEGWGVLRFFISSRLEIMEEIGGVLYLRLRFEGRSRARF